MNAQCWLKNGSVVMLEDVLILWWFWPTSRGCTTLHTRDERPDTLPPVCQPQVLTNTDSHVNNESKASILNPVEFWTLRATFFKFDALSFILGYISIMLHGDQVIRENIQNIFSIIFSSTSEFIKNSKKMYLKRNLLVLL